MSLERNLGFLIHQLAHTIHVELDRRLRTHGLTLPQWKILRQILQHEGSSQVELQERLGLERATITGLIQRLSAQGWIHRKPDEHDGRIQRVYITERGRALEPIVTALVEEVNETVLSDFSTDERYFFSRLITRAQNNIEQ